MMLRPATSKPNLVERSEILDAVGIARILRRVAFEIVERNGQDAYIVGIRTGGAVLAERMVRILAESGEKPPSHGTVDITLYRDDVFLGLPKPEIGPTDLSESINGRNVVLVDDVLFTGRKSINGRNVVLVDDVLFTGRTVRAAMDVLLDYGRPRKVELAVIVDRGRRELPIQPDYIGVRLQTTADQDVRVLFKEDGEPHRVVLRERSGQ